VHFVGVLSSEEFGQLAVAVMKGCVQYIMQTVRALWAFKREEREKKGRDVGTQRGEGKVQHKSIE